MGRTGSIKRQMVRWQQAAWEQDEKWAYLSSGWKMEIYERSAWVQENGGLENTWMKAVIW